MQLLCCSEKCIGNPSGEKRQLLASVVSHEKSALAFAFRCQMSCVVCSPWSAGPGEEILKTSSENR